MQHAMRRLRNAMSVLDVDAGGNSLLGGSLRDYFQVKRPQLGQKLTKC